MEQSFQNKLALVTGGSSGIGLATAIAFAREGASAWILARNPDRLSEALKSIESARVSPAQSFGCLVADVANQEQVFSVIHDFTAQAGAPDILVNSAGVARPGYVEEMDLSIFHEMMDINYFGTVYATRAVLPGMLKRGSGHIVNMATIPSFVAVYGYSAYGASKYAVRGYSDMLRYELKRFGIKVTLVIPADVQTPQLEYENQFKPPETLALENVAGATKPQKPEHVAADILKGIEKNKIVVLSGFDAKWMYFAVHKVGTWVYPILDFLMDQAWKKVPNPHKISMPAD